MDTAKSIFKNKKPNTQKLIDYGFKEENCIYTYKKILAVSGFILTVRISESGEVSSEITDPAFGEPYTLHLSDYTAGSFVGRIKDQYEHALSDISERCFEQNVFKSRQTAELTEYVRNTYCRELEFLWKKFSGNAIWRRADNRKWFGGIFTVPRNKLGLDSDETAEIIDLRAKPETIEKLVDGRLYFPGWHMNKKNWYTIILDGSVKTDELKRRIDESYNIAEKK